MSHLMRHNRWPAGPSGVIQDGVTQESLRSTLSLAEEIRSAVNDAVPALKMQSSEQPSAFSAKHADVGPQPAHGHGA